MCIQWRLRSACASAQPDHSLHYVMCPLDCTVAQANLSEQVNCRICCAQAQMIWIVINAIHVDLDQMPGSVASDLGLQCLPVSTVLQLALHGGAGCPSCPLLLILCPFYAAICLISTPDIKPYILVKISWKSDQTKKSYQSLKVIYMYSIFEVNIVEWDYIL